MTNTRTNGASDGTVTGVTAMAEVTDLVTTDEVSTSGVNGTSKIAEALASEREPYRPKASTDKVHETIHRTLGEVASEAIHQASNFVYLAGHGRTDESPKVRYGHLVDAAECLELAMVHLGRLQDAVFHRMQIDERNSLDDRC
jgi:hypothetical protein